METERDTPRLPCTCPEVRLEAMAQGHKPQECPGCYAWRMRHLPEEERPPAAADGLPLDLETCTAIAQTLWRTRRDLDVLRKRTRVVRLRVLGGRGSVEDHALLPEMEAEVVLLMARRDRLRLQLRSPVHG